MKTDRPSKTHSDCDSERICPKGRVRNDISERIRPQGRISNDVEAERMSPKGRVRQDISERIRPKGRIRNDVESEKKSPKRIVDKHIYACLSSCIWKEFGHFKDSRSSRSRCSLRVPCPAVSDELSMDTGFAARNANIQEIKCMVIGAWRGKPRTPIVANPMQIQHIHRRTRRSQQR